MSNDDVRAVIDRISDAWLSGPPDEIPARVGPCFHADAVVYGYGPDFKAVARGGDVCARSYKDFVTIAKVLSCTMDEPIIDVVDTTATVSRGWQMTYTLGDATYTESGHELLVLLHDGDSWRVVWRTLLPRPA